MVAWTRLSERARRAGGSPSAEDSVAQAVARRATELVVDSLDINALLGQVDVNAPARVDVDGLPG